MPRTMEEINDSVLNELHIQNMCNHFGLTGMYMEYRPVSANPYTGLYFVCGDAAAVQEVAQNLEYIQPETAHSPAWVERRALRNPDYFYTDVYAINVSDKSPYHSLNAIHAYCKTYEAVHTILKEFGSPIPKKIDWEDVVCLIELNKGRYNRDYPADLQAIYKDRLVKYINKTFTAKTLQQLNNDTDLAGQSNFVKLDYFVTNQDDVKFLNVKENHFQYLKQVLKSNPVYSDIKIYASEMKVLDYEIENTPGVYNPWANFESHFEWRYIGYRCCDEAVLASIFLQLEYATLTNATKDVSFMFEPCMCVTIPVDYLSGWDICAREDGVQYYIDDAHVYGPGIIGIVTILYHVTDEDTANTFFNRAMHHTATTHSEYLGNGQWDRVRRNLPKGNLADLLRGTEEQPKKKHGLFGRKK